MLVGETKDILDVGSQGELSQGNPKNAVAVFGACITLGTCGNDYETYITGEDTFGGEEFVKGETKRTCVRENPTAVIIGVTSSESIIIALQMTFVTLVTDGMKVTSETPLVTMPYKTFRAVQSLLPRRDSSQMEVVVSN
ncbi:hypothetical protein V6N13_046330 [Hibiscus sabdariffa]|uniref:Uncharacterized protein n=1 Tax=Hibiscus sabdariffa TaxID=183260 RepID=A0ABR2D9U2_9ROSI